MLELLRRWFLRPYSLTTRFIALTVYLFALLQVVQFFAFSQSVYSNAQQQQNSGFELAKNILVSQLEQRQKILLQSALVLASNPDLHRALASDDISDINSSLENQTGRIGNPVAMLLSISGRILASSRSNNEMLATLNSVFSLEETNSLDLFSDNNQLYQFVTVPITTPKIVGYIVMGFVIDASVLNQFTRIAGVSAVIVHGRNGSYRVQDSNLPTIKPQTSIHARLQSNDNFQLDVSPGQTFHPIFMPTRGTNAASVYVVIASSIEQTLSRYGQVKKQVLLITLLGGFLFALLSIKAAKKMTAPLRRLMEAASRISTGDLVTPIETASQVTEIQRLSTTLESMRANVLNAQTKIHQIAYSDPLTELPNRLRLLQETRVAMEKVNPNLGHHVFLLMFDLQRFKNVNDVLGYESADTMLIQLGQRANDFCNEHSLGLARISADEFAVLFPAHHLATFNELIERLHLHLDRPIQLLGVSVDVNTIAGYSSYPDDAISAEDLLKHAEIAMYEAKRRRQHTLAYHCDMDASSQKTLSLLSELRQAIAGDQLRLFVQPKIDLPSQKIDGIELLVRWQHPTKGLVPPLDFIPFAEQTGFIRQLTQWVFQTATKQQAILKARGLDLCLSLNLSVHDLLDTKLLSSFQYALAKQNVSASTFCLEITESAIMDDPKKALLLLEELRNAGFKLSIDDFGTGYSSLSYLKLLPVHELKIDQSFVMHMDSDPLDTKIVRSTIDLAHNLELYVTAEGIENESTLIALAQLGCDKAQGYHICRPMAFDDFLQWIETSPYRPDMYLPELKNKTSS